jgi:hypothetical protein
MLLSVKKEHTERALFDKLTGSCKSYCNIAQLVMWIFLGKDLPTCDCL